MFRIIEYLRDPEVKEIDVSHRALNRSLREKHTASIVSDFPFEVCKKRNVTIFSIVKKRCATFRLIVLKTYFV